MLRREQEWLMGVNDRTRNYQKEQGEEMSETSILKLRQKNNEPP